jgi:hypothetical protein
LPKQNYLKLILYVKQRFYNYSSRIKNIWLLVSYCVNSLWYINSSCLTFKKVVWKKCRNDWQNYSRNCSCYYCIIVFSK